MVHFHNLVTDVQAGLQESAEERNYITLQPMRGE